MMLPLLIMKMMPMMMDASVNDFVIMPNDDDHDGNVDAAAVADDEEADDDDDDDETSSDLATVQHVSVCWAELPSRISLP